MAKLSRQMLHSVWASPPFLPAGLFVGRSCEALSVYVTRRKSDIMLTPVEAHIVYAQQRHGFAHKHWKSSLTLTSMSKSAPVAVE